MPDLGIINSLPNPVKKPRFYETEQKKPFQPGYSGIMQSIKNIEDSISSNCTDSLLVSIKKLCKELTMSNEVHLSAIPIENLTESLLFALKFQDSPDVMHQSIQCINALIESHQNAVFSFVKAGAISLLMQKITNIEFIDVAELAVKALERISLDFPNDILKAGFASEIFGIFDFFF